MLLISSRLLRLKEQHGLNYAEIGRRLGVSGQHISQLISGAKKPSKQLLTALSRIEVEIGDPFLAACANILGSDDDRVVQGFTMNIYSVLGNIDRKEAERLKDLEADYLAQRKERKRARDAGESGGEGAPGGTGEDERKKVS